MNDAQIEQMRKRLLWRASHRGIKEMDLILGGYAAKNVATMNPLQLDDFAKLLDVADVELLAWLTAQSAAPEGIEPALLKRIGEFKPGPF